MKLTISRARIAGQLILRHWLVIFVIQFVPKAVVADLQRFEIQEQIQAADDVVDMVIRDATDRLDVGLLGFQEVSRRCLPKSNLGFRTFHTLGRQCGTGDVVCVLLSIQLECPEILSNAQFDVVFQRHHVP